MKTRKAYYPLHQKKGESERIYDFSDGRRDLFASGLSFSDSDRRSAAKIDAPVLAVNEECIPLDMTGDFILTLRCSTDRVLLRHWPVCRTLTEGVLEDEIS